LSKEKSDSTYCYAINFIACRYEYETKNQISKIISSYIEQLKDETLMMRKVHDITISTQQLRIRNSRMLVQIILLKRENMYKMPMLQHTSDNDNEQISHLSGEKMNDTL